MFTLEQIFTAVKGYFEPLPEAEVVYLFGSYADGSAGKTSDIDLAVLYRRDLSPEAVYQAHIRDWPMVSKALKTDAVDLVCLNSASSISLKFAVVQDGKIILDRGTETDLYEIRVRMEYFDHIATLKLAGY